MLAIGWSALAAQTMAEPEEMVDEGTFQGVPWLSGGVGKGERDGVDTRARFVTHALGQVVHVRRLEQRRRPDKRGDRRAAGEGGDLPQEAVVLSEAQAGPQV
jgi:hypothetical protein